MIRFLSAAAAAAVFFSAGASAEEAADTEALVAEALSAAPDFIAEGATVHNWQHQTLKKGSNGWVCLPTMPEMAARGESCPMCVDSTWHGFFVALQKGVAPKTGKAGISYMLAGDCTVSNLGPAHELSPENQLIKEGPHMMVLFPAHDAYQDFPTDPQAGGPYVMWKDTPYVHLMVPLERTAD